MERVDYYVMSGEEKDVNGHGHEAVGEGAIRVDGGAGDESVGITHRAGKPEGETVAGLQLGEPTTTRLSHDEGLSFHDPEKGVISRSVLPTASPSPSQSTHALTLRDDENFYPEGGLQAWLVVFGSLCSLLAALGVMNTFGSFQAYVSRNQLKDYSEGAIGWIFSVYASLAFGFGVIVGPIFDKHGARALMITGSVGVVTSLMLMSVCESMSPLSLPQFLSPPIV